MKRPRKRSAPQVRWSWSLSLLPALSVRQPWAWLIVNGYKDVENRSRNTRHRGPVLIHAGLNTSNLDERLLEEIERTYGVRLPRQFDRGGIVGVADIVGCARRSASAWHDRGAIGWILSKPRRLPFRACKGALGLFRPEIGRR